MFKNLIVYRLAAGGLPELDALEAALSAARFVPCGATQPQSAGWTEPRGEAHGALAESVGGQWLLRLMVEQKLLPGTVVKRRAQEIMAQIERSTGRKPGKRESKEIRDQATLELLPQAFTREVAVPIWIDPQRLTLVIDAASATRADDAVSELLRAVPGLEVRPLHTARAAATGMADWLLSGEPPAGFSVDRDCELKSADEMKSVVRYARHALDIDEVRQHIQDGKRPTRLAMTWRGRVSFVLTDVLHLKKIAFEDGIFEAQQEKESGFDADVALATGEFSLLIPDLIEALDGEVFPGQNLPATESAAAQAQALPGAAVRPETTEISTADGEAASDEPAPWN